MLSNLQTRSPEKSFGDWTRDWPGQAVHTAHSIIWTAEAETAITNSAQDDFAVKCSHRLSEIVYLVRKGGLSPRTLKTLRSLIVLLTYARDVADELSSSQLSKVSDFVWAGRLRYYLMGNEDDNVVRVNMVNTSLKYAFEYLGNVGRLVITPMVERCFRTLVSALRQGLGGAPQGPAGSGKSEMCKELARALAKHCVVFNCSDGVDYRGMGKFLKGLAQSGAWACFDEFNRIEMDVSRDGLCVIM